MSIHKSESGTAPEQTRAGRPAPLIDGGVLGHEAPAYSNRLSGETSPYLLQHAHNPVAWWAWGEEAFAEARRRDVPIFLSIGYSTCYWCHVMERESFEDVEIAALMNEHFVCIKVDREERPEVDNLYMAATQTFTGRGGWPMSVFLEPGQLRPFWCGTYFPAEALAGMQGPTWPQVLMGMAGAWADQRAGVLEQAEALAGTVREHLTGTSEPVPVGSRDVEGAVGRLLSGFDQVNGGFGGGPKFPQTVYAEFLLEARGEAGGRPTPLGERQAGGRPTPLGWAGEATTREAIDLAVRASLDAMAIGGIRDHVGGGFHRYATDATWTVPHFEKMLYDQALLARVYIRAARVYDDAEYKRVVREILEFVLREMTDGGGGFYSAQDAEVDGREGLSFLWTPTQMAAVLEPGEAEFAAEVYGLGGGPNFRDPHHPEEAPSHVLRISARPAELAARLSLSRDEFLMRLAGVNRKLYAARAKRAQPRLDDKMIAEWNGLMIAAFAEASVLFGDDRYFEAGAKAAGFVLGSMVGDDGRLRRSWRSGVSGGPGVLEDSACVVTGLLALAEAAGGRDTHPTDAEEPEWEGRLARQSYLDAALRLYGLAVEDFGGDDGGFYDTRGGREDLFVRARTTYDGAVPCGSSVMLHALLDLAEATGEAGVLDDAVSLVRSLSNAISRDPVASVNSTRGLLRLLGMDRAEVEVFAERGDGEVGGMATPLESEDAAGGMPAPLGGEVMPVEVYAETDRVEVTLEKPAELVLLVRIAEGYHITAAEPRVSDGSVELSPFRVFVQGGGGVSAYADYPEGEETGLAGATFRAYSDHFELRVAIEQTGELSGEPRLAIVYQACREAECLLPQRVELGVVIAGE